MTINMEYTRFSLKFSNALIDKNKFWNTIENLKNSDMNLIYSNILRVKELIEILSHSPTACERLFNILTLINLEKELICKMKPY